MNPQLYDVHGTPINVGDIIKFTVTSGGWRSQSGDDDRVDIVASKDDVVLAICIGSQIFLDLKELIILHPIFGPMYMRESDIRYAEIQSC